MLTLLCTVPVITLVIGYFLGRREKQHNEQIMKIYEKYTQDMKDFATCYSELSVQFVNQHLPGAPDASFSRSMPNRNNSNEDRGASQPPFDDFDMAGGNLNL